MVTVQSVDDQVLWSVGLTINNPQPICILEFTEIEFFAERVMIEYRWNVLTAHWDDHDEYVHGHRRLKSGIGGSQEYTNHIYNPRKRSSWLAALVEHYRPTWEPSRG